MVEVAAGIRAVFRRCPSSKVQTRTSLGRVPGGGSAAVLSHSAVCPTVFNVMNRPTAELWHRSDDRRREAWT